MLTAVKAANLALAFALELGVLAATGWWGGAGALALALRDRLSWAVGFFALFVLHMALAIVWDQ